MIKKIFIEKSNDERTKALMTILDIEKIPYYFIDDAEVKDFEGSLFLFTNQIKVRANHKIIFNPELLNRPLKVNQLEKLKLRVPFEKINSVLNEFNLSNEIDLPNVPVYKEIDKPTGEPICKILVNNIEHTAISKDKNAVYFFFDILPLFIDLISENYFEKKNEHNILSNSVLDYAYKLIPYKLRLPIYRKYYKKVHRELEKSNEFITKFPIDPTGFVLLELIKNTILLQSDITTISKWPYGHNYATLMTHDTEPTIFSYKKGLGMLLNKLNEHQLKSTITLVGDYVKHISQENIIELQKHDIGCHELYHDRKFLMISNYEKKERLETAKFIIQNAFGREISFFRAPTLQRPSDLFELLEEKEYKYDSSIIDVQREQPFCGKGNSFYLPFYPIIKNKKSTVLELTVTAPDCISPYFFGYSMEETLELFRKKIKFIEKVQGLGVYIIHTPAWGLEDAENRLKLLDEVIKNTKNSWMATLSQVTGWWEARLNLFLEFNDNRLSLYNNNNFEIENIRVRLENRDGQEKEFQIDKIGSKERVIVK